MPVDVLMVIAPAVFRDEEYAHPKEALERRGATVTTASAAVGECTGRFGLKAHSSLAIAEADPDGYNAVVFVGGSGAAMFFDDTDAHRLASAMIEGGKVLGAICIAPSILAHAGLLDGRRVTAFETREEDLVAHGAIFTGAAVEIDGSIVTANGPEAAWDFGMVLGDLLGLP